MPLYLELAVGHFRFLLEAVAVAGISRDADPVGAAELVDCRSLFGLAEPFSGQPPVRLRIEDGESKDLLVDSVVGTRSIEAGMFQPFPGQGEAARWFDAVAAGDGDALLPRMRLGGKDR